MTWQSGMPIVTADDEREWQAWRKARILEGQRWHRAHNRRIDYYPTKKAAAIIDAECRRRRGPDSTYGAIISGIVEEWASGLK